MPYLVRYRNIQTLWLGHSPFLSGSEPNNETPRKRSYVPPLLACLAWSFCCAPVTHCSRGDCIITPEMREKKQAQRAQASHPLRSRQKLGQLNIFHMYMHSYTNEMGVPKTPAL